MFHYIFHPLPRCRIAYTVYYFIFGFFAANVYARLCSIRRSILKLPLLQAEQGLLPQPLLRGQVLQLPMDSLVASPELATVCRGFPCVRGPKAGRIILHMAEQRESLSLAHWLCPWRHNTGCSRPPLPPGHAAASRPTCCPPRPCVLSCQAARSPACLVAERISFLGAGLAEISSRSPLLNSAGALPGPSSSQSHDPRERQLCPPALPLPRAGTTGKPDEGTRLTSSSRATEQDARQARPRRCCWLPVGHAQPADPRRVFPT